MFSEVLFATDWGDSRTRVGSGRYLALLKTASYSATPAILICLITFTSLSAADFSAHSLRSRDYYVYQTWTAENGLPENSVEAILQTSDGYLWIGTFGGLARFDGMRFKVFNPTNTPELRSLRIRTLYEDNEGKLWIGTEHGGLTRYWNGQFTNFTVRDGLPDNTVVSIAGDRNGGLWIGTMRGLARYDSGRFISYSKKPGMPRGPVSAICQDKAGRLWLGTYGKGLISWQKGKATIYSVKDGLPSDEIWALHETRNGSLWVGTVKGLARIRKGRITKIFAKDGRPIGWARYFAEDHKGNLWIASRSGLLRWDGHSLARFTRRDGLSESQVRSVFVDRENDLWIGTDASGLIRWRKSNVVAYAGKQGLSDQPARAIYQDRKGTVWVAIGSKLYTFKDGVFRVFHSSNGAFVNTPAAIDADPSGTLWIGDWEIGLLSLKDGQLRTYSEPPGLFKSIVAVHTDNAGAVWIGTLRNGVYRFKDGRFTNYRTKQGLGDNTVNCITEDHDGDLWMGTSVGISRFRDGHFTNYRAQGLASVRDIRVADGGALWIGTYGFGLFRFKDHTFVRISSKDGLFDDDVSDILEDGHGNYWMGGNKGIFWVSKKELNAFADGKLNHVDSESYGVKDGMIVSETNGTGYPSAWRARDGKLWFAMTKGVVVIDPDVADTLPPPVVIEQATVNGRNRPLAGPVRIRPGQTNLDIHYAALSFARPDKIHFKYMLTTLDKSWVDAGTRRTTYFPHLAAGRYTFKVIADNGEGVWNDKGASISIVVVPPYWRTWWFLSLILVSLAGTTVMGCRFRFDRLKRAKAEQEAFSRQLLASQEAERQRIAGALHDSLGQSLLVIKNRADLAVVSDGDHEAAKEQLVEISRAATHAVEEVREIAYDLHPYKLDRFGLVKTVHGICRQASHSCGIHFSTSFENIDGLLSKEVEISIYRIVQEAVSNIIRHSQATEAKLVIRRVGRGLLLRISDNGKGFVPAAVSSLTAERGGFGLVGIAERVRMLGGSYTMETTPGQGTTITIRLAASGGHNAR